MIVTSQKKSDGWLDDDSVRMNAHSHVDHSKGNPRFARRTGSLKAKPIASLERSPKTPFGPVRGWKRHDSDTFERKVYGQPEASTIF
jgi:hypothetical protein